MNRDAIYEMLTTRMRPIAALLDDYGRTDLDGVLWAMAGDLANVQGLDVTEKVVDKAGANALASSR